MDKCKKEEYENRYKDLKVEQLNEIGFERNYIHDYYVSGFYPPVSCMTPPLNVDLELAKQYMGNEVSLYFHYPACTSRCIYCHYYFEDHNLFESYEDRYVDCMCKELTDIIGDRKAGINFIYFGGGTPSLYKKESLYKIFKNLYKCGNVYKDAEIRFEIYPGYKTLEKPFTEKLHVLKEHGVTTIIIDMQSLDDKVLKAIGRNDTNSETFTNLIAICGEAGFRDFHTTLMIGLPYQTWDIFMENLESLVNMKKFSLINVFVVFNKADDSYRKLRASQPDIFPSNQDIDMMLMFARDYLKANGYEEGPMYFFYKRRNKVKYRSAKNTGNYLGFGAAAQSLYKIGNEEFYTFNIPSFEKYIERIESGRTPVWLASRLDYENTFVKNFISILYNRKYVKVDSIRKKLGFDPLLYYKEILFFLKNCGLVSYDDEEIRLTEQGLLRAERVVYFFASEDVSKKNDICCVQYEEGGNSYETIDGIALYKYSYFPTIAEKDKTLIEQFLCKTGVSGIKIHYNQQI